MPIDEITIGELKRIQNTAMSIMHDLINNNFQTAKIDLSWIDYYMTEIGKHSQFISKKIDDAIEAVDGICNANSYQDISQNYRKVRRLLNSIIIYASSPKSHEPLENLS